jgi:AcrR family transcriptional regulator
MANDETGRRDPRRSLALLWGQTERGTRGPKPALSVEQIVRAAIEIADAEGVDALSMRRVADKLSVGTMSLYRYVPGKGELIDLMLERVLADNGSPDSEPTRWRPRLESMARSSWRMYHEHPWMLLVTERHPVMGPTEVAGLESLLRAVSGLGLSPSEMFGAIALVDSFVRGMARYGVDAREAERRTGISTDEWWQAQGECLADVMTADQYPMMQMIGETGVWGESEDVSFEFGLERLLDGIQVLVDRRAGEAS